MTDQPKLYMLQLPLETRKLFELGKRRSLPLRRTDLDYLVHCQLGELFGDAAPTPFRTLHRSRREVDVLAYASEPLEALRARAETFADPPSWVACSWDRAADKPMPAEWPEGRRLGFEVRACPVVRKASSGPKHRAGAEVDVFLSRCWERPEATVDRESVYGEWLHEQLAGRGATLRQVRMEKFRLARLLRRNHADTRTASLCQRPDALFQGVLEVDDGSRFRELLERGVGRHRAFGFGMVLLRPA